MVHTNIWTAIYVQKRYSLSSYQSLSAQLAASSRAGSCYYFCRHMGQIDWACSLCHFITCLIWYSSKQAEQWKVAGLMNRRQSSLRVTSSINCMHCFTSHYSQTLLLFMSRTCLSRASILWDDSSWMPYKCKQQRYVYSLKGYRSSLTE